MKRSSAALLVLAVLAIQSFAASVAVTNTKLQTKYGVLTNVYFETNSGPGSATPSTNTAQTPSGTSGSYPIAPGSSGYLWSPQFSSSTGISAGNWIFNFWAAAAAYSYVPVTLTNGQSAATPVPLQVKVTWNPSTYASYEASNLGNIRFCMDTACASTLYAWLESCTTSCSTSATSASAWVRLTSQISGSGGTLTIYMVFLTPSTNFGSYWGEAPTLSGTYGQYDNGASVFTFYDNFAGTALSSKWTSLSGRSGWSSITVNNGLTIGISHVSASAYAYVISATQSAALVAETYTTSGASVLGVSTSQSVNGFVAPYSGYSLSWASSTDTMSYQASGGATTMHTVAQSSFPSGVWQVTWSATASQYFADGAGNTYTGSNNGVTLANYGIYIGMNGQTNANSVFYWARMRVIPPSNVLPSVGLGSVVSVSQGSVSVSIYLTDSTGTATSTVASGVQSPIFGTSEAMITMTFAGAQVTAPSNGYISVVIVSSSGTTVYWGSGQPTDFQVPFRVLT